jgi:hypothetical protein
MSESEREIKRVKGRVKVKVRKSVRNRNENGHKKLTEFKFTSLTNFIYTTK